MDLAKYQQALRQLAFGKRLPTALYVYRDASSDYGQELNQLVARLALLHQLGDQFNVLKFRRMNSRSHSLVIGDALRTRIRR